jgi:hypothetical protein
MHKVTTRARAVVLGVVAALAVMIVNVASAATDTTLTAQTTQITDYFKDNVGVVIGVFIAVACLLWLFSMAAASAGAKRRSKAG